MKLEVGMTVYIIPCGVNNTRGIKDITDHITETTIEKIGRKYFYVKGSDNKFNIDNLRYEASFQYDMQVYLNKQDIFDGVERSSIEKKLRGKFSQYVNSGLTLEQLRAIDEIISN